MTDVMIRDEELGSRTKRRRKRARRRIFTRFLVGAILVAVTGSAVYLVGVKPLAKTDGKGSQAVAPAMQETVLVAMTMQGESSQQADSLMVLAAGGKTDPGALFIPVGTLSAIPGQGFESIGKSLSFGRPALLQLTAENMLGASMHQTLVLDDLSLAKMIDALGGIDINVTERLVERGKDGRSEVVFPRGQQHMSGAQAAVYMTYRAAGETELSRFPRMQKVWQAILGRVRTTASLDEALVVIAGSFVKPEAVELFGTLLTRAAASGLLFEVLPAKPLGAGDDRDGYDLDEQAAADRVEKLFPGVLHQADLKVAARPRIEIRNGVGTPEAGEQVASLLIPQGMKIEVTGNSRKFDHEQTKIVVYSATEDSMFLARRVRDLLGLGTIEIGTRPQSVVDVTVVIGKDFEA